ncbi:MAG: hypothetical protein NTV22_14865 [bacterium]|nr:hypothetical protein [bacterium]
MGEPLHEHATPADDAAGTLSARANWLQQQLIVLLRQMAATQGVRINELGETLTLPLQLTLAPRRHWAPTALHQPLYQQLEHLLEELAAATDAYQAGRVYNYRAGSADGADSVPPTATAVFAGYSPTGVPLWQEFHQQLLDAHDPRVGLLFETPARMISQLTLGRDLKAQLLGARGKASHSYNILGQVTAGYFCAPGHADAHAHCALTAQIVEWRTAQRLFALALNIIGVTPEGIPLHDALDRDHFGVIVRACQPLQRALRRCERAVRALPQDAPAKARSEILSCIPRLLARLRDALDQRDRQALRRTRHAQQRREDERPVQCALDDLDHAAPAAFFYDEAHATILVRGPHARLHVFARDGRHVTTFAAQEDEVQRRVQRHLWRPATAVEITACRAALAALHDAARGAPARKT